MVNLEESLKILNSFFGKNPATRIRGLNNSLIIKSKRQLKQILLNEKIDFELLHSAFLIKQISAQIDTKIHCLGMLYLLEHILEEDEIIESLALGADNVSEFDLVTNIRIAEFKFGKWKGGDSMRGKKLFQDYFKLVECPTEKKKVLYVYERDPVLKFLNSTSTFTKILDKEESLRLSFYEKYGSSLIYVFEYYNLKKNLVEIIEIKDLLSQ